MISTQFPYFRPGYPRSNHGGQIGFYHPVFDRFILVVPQEVLVMEEISLLANLRYPVLRLYMSAAPGYRHTLVDNGCCDNWTCDLEDQHRKKIYQNDRFNIMIQQPQRLYPSKSLPPELQAFSMQEEKQWMQLLWFWQEFLEFVNREHNPYAPVIDFVRENLMPHSMIDESWMHVQQLTKKVNLILASETNGREADKKITDYMDQNCPELKAALGYFVTKVIEH